MKQYLTSILCFLCFIGFISCSDDNGYSIEKYWESFVTVNKVDDGTYSFTLDDGKKLLVAAPADLNLKPKHDRAIITYSILSDAKGGSDYHIKLNRFKDVLTKDIFYIAAADKHAQDSVGYDPIKIYSIWEGGDYLNIHFGFSISGEKAHTVNLVSSAPDLSIGREVVELNFRHNGMGDLLKYPTSGYVSFNIKPYRIKSRDKVTFNILGKNLNGETTKYLVEYKYK